LRALGHRLDVSEPFKGAPQTVALVKRYALEAQSDPSVRLLAERIVSGLDSKDYLSEIAAVYYYVLNHTRYANDPRTVELVRRPARVIAELAAGKTPSLDCDDLVAFQAALLLALGREVRIVTIAFRKVKYNGEIQYSHVYLQVKEPRTSTWIVLDPVAAEETAAMLKKGQALKIWPVA
jgi:hypothetical protein